MNVTATQQEEDEIRDEDEDEYEKKPKGSQWISSPRAYRKGCFALTISHRGEGYESSGRAYGMYNNMVSL
jgi:hypothetical protein